MAGPFDSILGMLGMGGGGGQPAPQPAEQPPASMVPPVRPPQFAQPGTVFGTFDNLLGRPTQEAWQAGVDQQKLQMEAEQNKVMAELTPEINRIREQNPGAQSQDVMRQLIASPTFTKAALRVPAPAMTKFMGDLVKLTQAPSPEAFQQGNSYGTRDPATGRVTIQGQVPTTEMQNRQHLLSLSAADRAALTALSGKAPSDKEEATANLVRMGKITEEQRQKILAGQLVVQPIRDQYGTTTGHAVVDLTAGQTQMLPPPVPDETSRASAAAGDPSATTPAQQTAQAAPNAPAQQQAAQRAGAGTDNPIDLIGAKPDNDFQNPADVYDASSPLGTLTGQISSLTGNLPGQETSAGPRVNMARQRLRAIRTGAQKIKEGRQFASEVKTMEDLMPNPDAYMQNPLDEVNKAIERRRAIGNYWQQDAATLADKGASAETKKKASARIAEYKLYLANEAPMPSLLEKRALLMQGQGGTSAKDLLSVIPTGQTISKAVGDASQAIDQREAAQADAQNPYLKMDQAGLEAEAAKPNLNPQQKRQMLDAIRRLKAGQTQPQGRAPAPAAVPPPPAAPRQQSSMPSMFPEVP